MARCAERDVTNYNGPPLEAYSRVTNPERFAPLHKMARELFDELESTYAVTRDADVSHFSRLRPDQHVSSPVCLTPVNPLCAPLRVAFTTFPGLILSFGWNVVNALPGCGCDACAETFEGETEKFREFVKSVVAGDFEEVVDIPFFGNATHTWSISNPLGMHRSAKSIIIKSEARALIKRTGTRSRRWAAWQLRA